MLLKRDFLLDSIETISSSRIHFPSDRPFETIQHAAVAIKQTTRGFHIGLLYREKEIRFLHLEWHLRLSNNPPNAEYLWIALPIHERRAKQLAAKCRLVWNRNSRDGIPYGFSDPRDFLSQDGKLNLGPTKFGLTCASFVLAVFELVGLSLIKYDTWKERGDDKVFQNWVVSELERAKVDPTVVIAVKSEMGLVRFRPCEVAGAATVAPPPVVFDNVPLLDRLIAEKCAALSAALKLADLRRRFLQQ